MRTTNVGSELNRVAQSYCLRLSNSDKLKLFCLVTSHPGVAKLSPPMHRGKSRSLTQGAAGYRDALLLLPSIDGGVHSTEDFTDRFPFWARGPIPVGSEIALFVEF